MTLTRQEAFRRICSGGVLVYPTETFFGIGCRADDEAAVKRVFQCKRRPLSMPLPVILGSAEQLGLVACPGPELSGDLELLTRFWPGPLTLLLPAVSGLPEVLTGGSGRIAARVSSHPAARELALACGFPIVSTSANVSGRPAVTCKDALDPELISSLQSETDGVFDALPAPGGGEASTIVEPLGQRRLRLLRQGALPVFSLEEAGFTLLTNSSKDQA
ncbi:L-threonylcarbamoyladenylate synthase [uncultured Mailhella sp.]|uniref:L-threonylcarbamoyladenylate synthase n=1 Tax=uncultured Mailhella sp. TaxID=1981031 RepID=UPI0025CD22F0|nr:L-threonylcarbamoyladenylate synthase [uncultured Mailhella sp.]